MDGLTALNGSSRFMFMVCGSSFVGIADNNGPYIKSDQLYKYSLD